MAKKNIIGLLVALLLLLVWRGAMWVQDAPRKRDAKVQILLKEIQLLQQQRGRVEQERDEQLTRLRQIANRTDLSTALFDKSNRALEKAAVIYGDALQDLDRRIQAKQQSLSELQNDRG